MNLRHILNEIASNTYEAQGVCEALKYYSLDEIEQLIKNDAFNKTDPKTRRRLEIYILSRINTEILWINKESLK